jgi:glycosyltransferase involved in cell wall biosynthesis
MRQYHFLEQLARRCAVTLATLAEERVTWPLAVRVVPAPDGDERRVSAGGDAGMRLARRYFGFRPAVAAWLRSAAVSDAYDTVLLSGARMGVYAGCAALPTTWDLVDELVVSAVRGGCGAHGWWRAGGDLLRLALFERAAARRCRHVLCASADDASYLRRWTGARNVAVVSNGVALPEAGPSAGTPGTVVFVGSLAFEPNIDAMRWFVPHVWQPLHRANRARRLLIVGREPAPAVRALTAYPGVSIHADVASVQPFLRAAVAVVVPIRRGAGVKNKLLEACAAGAPVIASRQAVAGLSLRANQDVLVAGSARQWRDRLAAVLGDAAGRQRLATAGQCWVRAAHRWEAIGDRLVELVASTAAVPAWRLTRGAG